MASRPLAIGPRSPHVGDIENSEEECGKCGLNADHHSGEAKHRMHLGRNTSQVLDDDWIKPLIITGTILCRRRSPASAVTRSTVEF